MVLFFLENTPDFIQICKIRCFCFWFGYFGYFCGLDRYCFRLSIKKIIMKFRFHWGWAIGVFYSAFVGAMIFMVFYSKTVDHSLERDNYYDYDIGYEKLIGEKMRNANALTTKLKIVYNETGKRIDILFPSEFQDLTGEIWFYRNNNKKLDTKLPVKVDTANIQSIDISNFPKGKWKVSVDWKSADKSYLNVNEFYFN